MCVYVYVYIHRHIYRYTIRKYINTIAHGHTGGARGVMVIVVGNGHGATSSNPGRD